MSGAHEPHHGSVPRSVDLPAYGLSSFSSLFLPTWDMRGGSVVEAIHVPRSAENSVVPALSSDLSGKTFCRVTYSIGTGQIIRSTRNARQFMGNSGAGRVQ